MAEERKAIRAPDRNAAKTLAGPGKDISLWARLASWPSEDWLQMGETQMDNKRPWTLSIVGLRAEGSNRVLRLHSTGSQEPYAELLPGGAMVIAGWGSKKPEGRPSALASAARAVNNGSGWRMSMFAGEEELGHSDSTGSGQHSYGNVFAKFEIVSGRVELVECGIELTKFVIPVPGKQHERAVLKTWKPDDPTLPPQICVVLARH